MQKRNHLSIDDAYCFLVLGLHECRMMSIVLLEKNLAWSDRLIREQHTLSFGSLLNVDAVEHVVGSTTRKSLVVLMNQLGEKI